MKLNQEQRREVDQLHAEACQQRALSYIDPSTGYQVFTAISLEGRERCCGCGCRHCPFGHIEVPSRARHKLDHDPWIDGERLLEVDKSCDVLFWSGGKDSYLTYKALQEEQARPLVLLTTFDGRSEIIAHQELALEQIQEQAYILELPLLCVPLYPGSEYTERVGMAIDMLIRRLPVRRLVFGDLHLAHIKQWREEALANRWPGVSLHFPLWQVPYERLMAQLVDSGAQCTISAVVSDALTHLVEVGQTFDQSLLRVLPEGIDPFGENGEFHTYIRLSAP